MKKHHALAAALVVVAGVLRLPRAWLGLPYLTTYDESPIVFSALDMMRTGDLNPHWFRYGSVPIYLTLAADIAAYFWSVSHGWSDSLTSFTTVEYGTSPYTGIVFHDPAAMLWPRLVFAAISVAACVVAFTVARRLGGTSAGAVAGLILALSPLYSTLGPMLNVDALGAFFALLSIRYALDALDSSRARPLILSGIAAGLAAGCKYNLALAVLVPVVAAWRGRSGFSGQRAGISVAAAAGAFLLTNPFTLLDLSNFLYWAGWEARHYGVTGHPGAEGPTGTPQAWHHLRFVSSSRGVGPLAFLAVAAGVVGLWRRNRHPAAILAVFPGVLLLLLATQKVNFTRNLIPAYPAIAIFAGLGCAAAIERIRAVRGTGRRTLALAVLTAGLFGPLLARASVDMSTAVRYRNPQDLVTGWLHVNSRPGATVAIAAQIPWSARDLDTAGFDVVQFDVGRTDPAALSRVDYVVMARHWRTALQPLVRSPFDWGRYLDESANVRVCYGRAPVRTELNENPLLCIVNPPTAEQVRALGGGGQGEIDTTRPGPRPGGPTVLGLAAGGASTASPQTPVSGWPPEPLAPDDGASVGTLQPMLRVRNAAWPAPVTGATYRFEISTSPDFRENRLVFEGVPEGPSFTDVHINRSLDPATLYFWRVRAAAARALSPHSEVWSFRTPRAADVQK